MNDAMAELDRAAKDLDAARKARYEAAVRGVLTPAVERRLLEAESIHLVAGMAACATWKAEQWERLRSQKELTKLQAKYDAEATAVLGASR